MLHAMFAGSRIERDFEMVTVQRQNLLALMLMQAVSVRIGVRSQTQVLKQIGLQILPPQSLLAIS
ncbi:hypothetical protein D3C87_1298290 [compost metagenome]